MPFSSFLILLPRTVVNAHLSLPFISQLWAASPSNRVCKKSYNSIQRYTYHTVTAYQTSERASVRLAARGTAPQDQMPVPAPSGPYMATPYVVPLVLPFLPPASTQAHISHPLPFLHLRPPLQVPHDHVDRKRPYNSVGAGDSVTSVPSRPPSSTSAANSGSSTDDQPKPKRARTKSKAVGGSTSGECHIWFR